MSSSEHVNVTPTGVYVLEYTSIDVPGAHVTNGLMKLISHYACTI